MRKRYFFIISLIFVLTIIVQAQEMGTIKGTVQEDKYGIYLPNITVQIEGTNYTTNTNLDGEFKLSDIPPGKYNLVCTGAVFSKVKANNILVRKKKTTLLNFKLSFISYSRIATLAGIITDKNTGKSISGASIIIEQEDFRYGTETNKYGQFISNPLRKSIANIFITAKGYKPVSLPKTIVPFGKMKFIEISLEKMPFLLKKTFHLKYKDTRNIKPILLNELTDNGEIVKITANAITIRDTKENIDKISSLLARYDAPLKQMWLEVRLIAACQNESQKTSLPENLGDISKQLHALFQFTNYELLDDARIRVTENESCRFVTGKGKYNIAINRVEYKPMDGGLIKLKNFVLAGKRQTILSTSVNIPNGDTLILGASSTDESGKALITAVTAKVM